MKNPELKSRETKMINFINGQTKTDTIQRAQTSPQATHDSKVRKLLGEKNKCKEMTLDCLFGRVFRNALPLEDPNRDQSDIDAGYDFHQYINGRTNGRGTEFYVREALKKNNSKLLSRMLEFAESVSKEFMTEKMKDIGTISISDLNYKPDFLHDSRMDEISRKLELDEISDIIKDNVQKTIQEEKDRALKEEEYTKQIEEQLANDDSVVDDETMKEAVDRLNKRRAVRNYQPSLFEGILLGKGSKMESASAKDIYQEAVKEFTMLNMSKAFRLENFGMPSNIRTMAMEYATGKR